MAAIDVDVGPRKRKLDESRNDYERFAKRFNLLNLGMSDADA